MKYLSVVAVLFVLSTTVVLGQVVYNNASTAGESYARGVSGIIQAQGERNLSNSQAAINAEDAYSKGIDNSLKSVNAFWEKRELYAEHQRKELEAIGRQRDTYLAKHGLGTLSPAEFDRTTGQITWLKLLQQKQYDSYRQTLEQLLQKRAYQGALTGDDYMLATATSKEWRTMLGKEKDVYPAPILAQMIRFVLKIDRELNDNLS